MSRNELVSAYQNGRIDRRAFIKGMSALGLSLTVATSMADKLRAAPAPKPSVSSRPQEDDTYEPVDEEVEVVVELPNTGIGGDGDKTNWAPAAIIGGAAAVVAARIRRTKPSETN